MGIKKKKKAEKTEKEVELEGPGGASPGKASRLHQLPPLSLDKFM
jgi:hypothetical protein